MEATINPQGQEQQFSSDASHEKSELMRIFESQVNDVYWAYKDLLKAILESDNEA